jgi:cytochrome P450
MSFGDWLLGAVCLVAAVVAYMWLNKRNGHRGLPGFTEYPVIGALLSMQHDDLTAVFIERLRELKFAPVGISVVGQTLMISSEPEDAEFVLQTGFDKFVKGKAVHDAFEELLGSGIFAVDGAEWAEHRKAASHLFATGKLRAFQEHVFAKDAKTLADILDEKCRLGAEVDLQALVYSLTFDSFCDLAFGVSFDTLAEVARTNRKPPFLAAFDDLVVITGLRFYRPLWRLMRVLGLGEEGRAAKCARVVHETVDRLALRALELTEAEVAARDDLLSMYVLFARQHGKKEPSLQYLRDACCNMILAGRDTSACTLTFFFRLMHHYPAARDKLEAEIDRLMAQNDGPLTYERLKDFVFLDACIMETLRLFPPVTADLKLCVESCTLPSGLEVRQGDLLYWHNAGIQRNSKWWQDGEAFRPERWIDKTDKALQVPESKQVFTFPAFNGGPRLCLGKRMALIEIKNAIATIMHRRLRFELTDKTDDIHSWSYMTSAPVISHKAGVHGRIVRR